MHYYDRVIEEAIYTLELALKHETDQEETENLKEDIEWHKDLRRGTQNLFDEAHACAETLIEFDLKLGPPDNVPTMIIAKAYELGYLKALRDAPENISRNKQT